MSDKNQEKKRGHVAPSWGQRKALGEISQNVPKPVRSANQPGKKKEKRRGDAGARSKLPVLVDKENVFPAESSGPAPVKLSNIKSSSSQVKLSHIKLQDEQYSEVKLSNIKLQDEQYSEVGSSCRVVDISSVSEYSREIYKYNILLEAEEKNSLHHNYMVRQPHISHRERSVLVNWEVEVGQEFQLQTETLYRAVSYTDRFLSSVAITRSELQLVGATAMFIASKTEELHSPYVGDFSYITDYTYTKNQILHMEKLILKELDFRLSGPTASEFLSQLCGCHLPRCGERIRHLAMYVCELSLLRGYTFLRYDDNMIMIIIMMIIMMMLGHTFLRYAPSLVAAASLVLARHTLSRECRVTVTWPEHLVRLTGYTSDSLRPCVTALRLCWGAAPCSEHQSIRDKYKSAKYQAVAEIPVPALRKHF